MELKWPPAGLLATAGRFNRTFMELKSRVSLFSHTLSPVLIVPLWN